MPTVLNILDKKGKVLASSKPVGSCGASFTEFTLKVPEIAGDCFVLQLHNKSGGNLFVNKLELH
jgi:hypothetical protein